MVDFVIWGTPKGQTEDTLLLASVQGSKITTLEEAKKYQTQIETRFGATKTRIQEINMGKPLDWKSTAAAAISNSGR